MIMKIKNIFLALGGALLLSGSLASCSDDEKYDFDGIPYDRIYFESATTLAEGTIVKTPVGNFASLDGEKGIKVTAPTTKAIHVKFAIDNSLVEAYNEAHETDYEVAPAGVFSLSTEALTIEADTTASKEKLALAITDDGIDKLESDKSYLVPVLISGSDDANFRASSNVGVTYYLVKVSTKLIKDDGNINDLTKIDDKTGWTVTSNDPGASNLNNMVDGNNNTNASFSKGEDVEVVVNFGKETSFAGIQIVWGGYYYAFGTSKIEYSTDGTNWSGIGSVNASGNWSAATTTCVLYGAISAQYIRFSGSTYYPSWYRPSIKEFNLYK